MNRKQVQALLSEHYPDKMIYGEAHRVQLGGNPTRYRRLMGSTVDRMFSVEMIGRPTKLKMLKFMMPNFGPVKPAAIEAIAEMLQSMYPEAGKGKWLRETAATAEPGQQIAGDRVGVEVMTLGPDERSIDVLFVTIK